LCITSTLPGNELQFGQELLLYLQSTSSTVSLRSHSIEPLSRFVPVLLPFLMLVIIRAETRCITYIKSLHVFVAEFPHSFLYNTTGRTSALRTFQRVIFIILWTQTAKIKSYLIQRVWSEGHTAGLTTQTQNIEGIRWVYWIFLRRWVTCQRRYCTRWGAEKWRQEKVTFDSPTDLYNYCFR